MNRMHAITLIQRTVLEENPSDAKDVFLKLRSQIPNGGMDEVLSRKEIEAVAEGSIQTIKNAHFPVERAKLRLELLESELRADLLDALAGIELKDPDTVREVFQAHQELASSSGPASLRNCIDLIEASGADVAPLLQRLLDIYPEPKDEEAPSDA